MTRRVLKWEVPVDDAEHLIGTGRVLHVDTQGDPRVVVVWTQEADDPEPRRRVRVFGTGQHIPDTGGDRPEHLGSVVLPIGLVWHLFETGWVPS